MTIETFDYADANIHLTLQNNTGMQFITSAAIKQCLELIGVL